MRPAAALLISLLCASCAQEREARKAPARIESNHPCVNINSASAKELIGLPGIGEATARKILEHREKYGPFRRPEQIIIIDGMSERRYRALAGLICTQ
jgi:competence ComEA-like helix-hairpin-helix protein